MNLPIFEQAVRDSRAFKIFSNDLSNGRLGHAYMLISADDEIVNELFKLVGVTMFCERGNGCMECSACTKVLDGNHADFHLINAVGANLKVADVSALNDEIGRYPREGSRALYCINRADLMNDEAQNKFLKTLEEPPEHATIILGVAKEAAMKPTIRSRCRIVNVDNFSPETVRGEILRITGSEEKANIAAACSEGSLGKALAVATGSNRDTLYNSALEMLAALKRSSDVHSLACDKTVLSDFANYLSVLSVLLRDLMVGYEDESLVFSVHVAPTLNNLAANYSVRALAEIQYEITKARAKLQLNLNAQNVYEALLMSILEIRFKYK